jgi:GNAT superfamily N-acetyltransferase
MTNIGSEKDFTMNNPIITIKRSSFTDNDFVLLISNLDDELNKRHDIQRIVYDQYNKVDTIQTVIIAYINDVPIGCGCFKPFDDSTVEIKRMFVEPAYRGKGISKLILNELEKWAKELSYSRSVLETGIKLPEAIGLYEKSGYVRINNYRQYKDLPNSLCFEKILTKC